MSEIRVDTISEKTSANGVAVDGVTLKDGGVAATDGSTITTADNTDTLSLISTDADANSGPNLRFYRNSGSPADNDYIGEIQFEGRNDNSQDVVYAGFATRILDASDGTEDGRIELFTIRGGSQISTMVTTATATVFNEDSIDHDFRVESNSLTHMLFVDANTDKVAIGHDTPTAMLHVKDNANDAVIKIETTDADANVGPILELYRNSSSPADGDVLGRIDCEGRNDNSQDVMYAQIRTITNDVTDGVEDGELDIKVMNNGTLNVVASFSGPETVINDASIDHDFRVESNGNTHMLFVDGANDRVFIGGINATLGELGITGEANGNANIDLYQSCGSSVRGKAEIFFTTDSSSDHESMASIVMEQPSGDQASRKGQMIFNVSDNGAPGQALIIENNGVVSGNLNDTSDENLKKNIEDLGASTDIIKALKPRKFDWKQTSAGSNIAGFIAQEVATVLPDAVVGNDYIASTYYIETDDIPEGYAVGDIKDHGDKGKALNTTAILAHAVKTIQELEARITTLEG